MDDKTGQNIADAIYAVKDELEKIELLIDRIVGNADDSAGRFTEDVLCDGAHHQCASRSITSDILILQTAVRTVRIRPRFGRGAMSPHSQSGRP